MLAQRSCISSTCAGINRAVSLPYTRKTISLDHAMINPLEKRKKEQLRRMQAIATALLIAMVALLGLSTALMTAYPWLQWAQAFAAAATVGAIADWFAVVALFHHPLGLPLPHTAIVPAKKDRIGTSLGQFVEQNFLTPANVIREVEGRNLTLSAADWLADPKNADALAQRLCTLIPSALDTVGDNDFRRLIDRAFTSQLKRLNIASVAGEILTILTADGRHHIYMIRTLHALEAWLLANQEIVKAKFSAASKFTPGIFDKYIVNKFIAGVITLIQDVASDPNHPIRQQFEAFTLDFIHKLKTSPEYAERAGQALRDFAMHIDREDYYAVIWKDVKQRILGDISGCHSLIRTHIAEAICKSAAALRADARVQTRLNGWCLQGIEALVRRHAHQVSALITEVVKRWDTHEVAQKLELEIGKDLQYIRISGTLVGGIVGLLMHAVMGLV